MTSAAPIDALAAGSGWDGPASFERQTHTGADDPEKGNT
jgi:hypothetical protein